MADMVDMEFSPKADDSALRKIQDQLQDALSDSMETAIRELETSQTLQQFRGLFKLDQMGKDLKGETSLSEMTAKALTPLQERTSSLAGIGGVIGGRLGEGGAVAGAALGGSVEQGKYGQAAAEAIGAAIGGAFKGQVGAALGSQLGTIVAQGLGNVAQAGMGAFDTLTSYVAKWNPGLAERATMAVEDFQASIGYALAPVLEGLIPVMRELADFVATVAKGINALTSSFGDLLPVLTKLALVAAAWAYGGPIGGLAAAGVFGASALFGQSGASMGMAARTAGTTSITGLGEQTMREAFGGASSPDERTAVASEGIWKWLTGNKWAEGHRGRTREDYERAFEREGRLPPLNPRMPGAD